VVLRAAVEARRRALSPQQVARWGGEVQKNLAALLFSGRLHALDTLALYAAQPFEVPLWAVFDQARAEQVVCAFPRVVRGSRLLEFCALFARAQLRVVGPLKLEEPPAQAPRCELAQLAAVIVPGVAFTSSGARLGRGGGYYDTTLAQTRALRVGVSFECCVVDDLPEAADDLRVDVLVTEKQTVFTGARR
jgi:5-formyltetrahydrofolate cyclo-ligase